MMNAEEQEYMDYLIHNRTQLTIEIGRHLDEILLLQKRLGIAVKALQFYADKGKWHYHSEDIEQFYTTKDGWYEAEQALKEMEKVQ